MKVSEAKVRIKDNSVLFWLQKIREASSSDWREANSDFGLREILFKNSKELAVQAYRQYDPDALACLHSCLSIIYEYDFGSVQLSQVNCEVQPILRDIAAVLEGEMLYYEEEQIVKGSLESCPTNSSDYVNWLRKVISQHRCSSHPVYGDYIASRADYRDLTFYFIQESHLDPRFDDILALMQVGLPIDQKLELAQNYWDEMGNGEASKVHAHMFQMALDALDLKKEDIQNETLTEALGSGNLSACLALSRRHYFKAVGYFGVTEYLAPRRFKHVVRAWRRNSLPEIGIKYHDLHIGIDARHSKSWFDNVVSPLVDRDPDAGREIATGAFIRLNSSARYLDQLLKYFNIGRS